MPMPTPSPILPLASMPPVAGWVVEEGLNDVVSVVDIVSVGNMDCTLVVGVVRGKEGLSDVEMERLAWGVDMLGSLTGLNESDGAVMLRAKAGDLDRSSQKTAAQELS